MFGVNDSLELIPQHLYWLKSWALTHSFFLVDLLGCLGLLSHWYSQLLLSFSWQTATPDINVDVVDNVDNRWNLLILANRFLFQNLHFPH